MSAPYTSGILWFSPSFLRTCTSWKPECHRARPPWLERRNTGTNGILSIFHACDSYSISPDDMVLRYVASQVTKLLQHGAPDPVRPSSPSTQLRATKFTKYLTNSNCCPWSLSGDKSFMTPPKKSALEEEEEEGDDPSCAASFPAAEPSSPRSPFPEGCK